MHMYTLKHLFKLQKITLCWTSSKPHFLEQHTWPGNYPVGSKVFAGSLSHWALTPGATPIHPIQIKYTFGGPVWWGYRGFKFPHHILFTWDRHTGEIYFITKHRVAGYEHPRATNCSYHCKACWLHHKCQQQRHREPRLWLERLIFHLGWSPKKPPTSPKENTVLWGLVGAFFGEPTQVEIYQLEPL